MSKPIFSRETLIHGCWPILVVPLLFTIYVKGAPILDDVHQLARRAYPDFEMFIPEHDVFMVCEIDESIKEQDARLNIFEGIYWVAMMKDQGDEYHTLMSKLRDTVFHHITELYPIDVFDDE